MNSLFNNSNKYNFDQDDNSTIICSNKPNPTETFNYSVTQNDILSDYPNMMNQNQSINNINLNNLEDNRNLSFNSNDNYFKSLIGQLESIEKKSSERFKEHNLKKEELINWFRNFVQR
mgnify:FL=1